MLQMSLMSQNPPFLQGISFLFFWGGGGCGMVLETKIWSKMHLLLLGFYLFYSFCCYWGFTSSRCSIITNLPENFICRFLCFHIKISEYITEIKVYCNHQFTSLVVKELSIEFRPLTHIDNQNEIELNKRKFS